MKLTDPESVRESAIAAQAAKDGAIVTAILPSLQNCFSHGTASWPTLHPKDSRSYSCITFQINSARLRPIAKAKIRMPCFTEFPPSPSTHVDAVAVYRVAYEAILRARQGRGATLLECLAHPDTSVETNENAADPVSSMENYLKRKGIEPEQHRRHIVDCIQS